MWMKFGPTKKFAGIVWKPKKAKKFGPTKKIAGIVWKPYKAGREREQLHAIAQNHSTIILRNKSPHTNINLSVKYVKIYILQEMIPTL